MVAESGGAEGRGLVVRLAERDEDFTFLMPLMREFHHESHYRDMPLSFEAIGRQFRQCLDRPDRNALIMAAHGGRPVGLLPCIAGPYLISDSATVVTTQAYFVTAALRGTLLGGRVAVRMLRGAVRWAEARDAWEIMVNVTAGIDPARADRFLRKAGFRTLGGNYSLRLERTADDEWSGE